jgi:leucyl/phenylalanyl-tRNA--protein transferase
VISIRNACQQAGIYSKGRTAQTTNLKLQIPLPLFALDEKNWFPPVEDAMGDGLLAFGGDITVERLLLAYTKGIFPWYDGGIPLWWSPDPRFVLFPGELRISHSMRQLLKKDAFEFYIDQDFTEVMRNCQQAYRKDQPGTWISDEFISVYSELHRMGHAHCASVYKDGEMVGGLYGIRVNNVFCGESMFSHVSNASKFAFIRYVQYLDSIGIELIDCQVHTEHLESLGARMISRNEFCRLLQ